MRPYINTWSVTLHLILFIVSFSIFSMLSRLDEEAFNVKMGLSDIITFTVANHTTSSTNIAPKSTFAKIFANIHRVLSFALLAGIIVQNV